MNYDRTHFFLLVFACVHALCFCSLPSFFFSILFTYLFILQHWFSLIVAVTVSGLLEAYTAQLDNAFLPLVFFSLLCL